jgi:phosphoglucosamine mutase
MKKLFGTDGVRGTANIYPMTAEMALSLGRAIAYLYRGEEHRHRILVGKDTRRSSYMIENAMVAGICSMGTDVLVVGPMPTPAVAFITKSMRAEAGVMISASHNSFEDNGIKFFDLYGNKLDDEIELEIEKLVLTNLIDSIRPTAESIGKAFRIDDAQGRYIEFVKQSYPHHSTLEGLKVVLDCANGAAYSIAPIVLEELGAEVVAVNVEPDGTNINKNSGCIDAKLLAAKVKECSADIGVALDGDGDRAVFADERGNIVSGDACIAMLANKLKRERRLAKDTIVITETSSIALDRCLYSHEIGVVRCQVGDRYVLEAMRKGGYSFGGEQSGHLILAEYSTTGDGIVAALQILAELVQKQLPLSVLSKIFEPSPQSFANVRVGEKKDFNDIGDLAQTITKIENALGNEGRVLLRYSGTEPLARIMLEGPKQDVIDEYAQDIANIIEKNLGRL